MDAPHVFIPIRHQAAPNVEKIEKKLYLPKASSLIYLPPGNNLGEHLLVEKSRIHGLGLFADRVYDPHDLVWRETLHGRLATPEDDGPLRWTNHSDNPNCVLLLDHTVFEVGLVAVRHIPLGEEITYDYKVFGHSGRNATCNCNELGCPGYFTLRSEWGERR